MKNYFETSQNGKTDNYFGTEGVRKCACVHRRPITAQSGDSIRIEGNTRGMEDENFDIGRCNKELDCK